MSTIINLPSIGGYHFGSMNKLNPFINHYFEEIKPINPQSKNKATIISIEYNPNELYNKTDGYAGNCWTANVKDSREDIIIIYNFRNFRDLVAHYEKEGFKFV